MSHTRLLATAAGVAIFLIVLGVVREGARFGWSGDPLPKLQRELAARVAERTRLVQTTAARVSRQNELVAAAATSMDRLSELFSRMNEPAPVDAPTASATVWINVDGPARYRPLAWTDGPAEQIPPPDLDRGQGLLVITAASGLRLVALQPILRRDGARIGVAAAETLLSSTASVTFGGRPLIQTSVGLLPIEAITTPLPVDAERLVIDVGSRPMLVVDAPLTQVAAARQSFRWRWIGIAAIPLVVYVGIALIRLVGRRGRSRGWVAWAGWTLVLVAAALVAAAAVAWLLARMGLDAPGREAAVALAAFFIAAVGPVALWCRTKPQRLRAGAGSIGFLLEHAAGGGLLLAAMLATDWLWRTRITPASIEQWHLPVLPSNLTSAVGLTSLLLVQIAMLWAVASVLGLLATRWRLPSASARFVIALLCWVGPSAAALALKQPTGAAVAVGLGVVVAAAVVFGFIGPALRRFYRQGSEVRRLVLQFLALVAPVLCVYPLASAAADRATREVIEHDYGPATQAARQPGRLMDTLTSAWTDLDAATDLPQLLQAATGTAANTELAFRIWNRTKLSRERVASQIELYGPDSRLVSRFSLNVPEINTTSLPSAQRWTNGGCDWDAFSETARFGAGERNMLHAERALCDATGRFLGAIVVRIIPDYRTLPFVASANPYYDALGQTDSQRIASRVPELQVVVYGWSLQPLFVSGRVIWPLDNPLFEQLYRSRDPFWAERDVDGRRYHVHLRSDRGGIYAVGYPNATAMQHVTRLAESGALLALLFFIYLTATVVTGPMAWRGAAPPLERAFAEIRASFTRKLFLYFVAAAVLPVILFAVAFGAYMTSRLRADVESEAGSVVLMARRVLDELRAAQTVPGQEPPAATDDLMVWIRQVIDQDVNLFEGSGLHATSQRDLFEAGLLSARTPAGVYRRIALERRPVAVVDDRIGTLRYSVAAVPVQVLGRDAALTVPLASRQREIERQIDELTRGVLAGAVVLVLFAAALGASVAGRVSDPVARLTRATRLVAAGRFDERLAADTADELGRLVEDFNKMVDMLVAQRAELARTNQVRAWAEMARQVAHEIKNPLTPIQLAAEHLQRVHIDAGNPLGPVVEQCLVTILSQVSLLRRIASEFSTFASQPTPRLESLDVVALVRRVVEPYLAGLPETKRITVEVTGEIPRITSDRTLLARALTNLVENALQAMPGGGELRLAVTRVARNIWIEAIDTGVGMGQESLDRAFEPYFSTKTAGSGLGLANARRNIEMCGGTIALTSAPGKGTTVTVTLPIDRDARGTE